MHEDRGDYNLHVLELTVRVGASIANGAIAW